MKIKVWAWAWAGPWVSGVGGTCDGSVGEDLMEVLQAQVVLATHVDEQSHLCRAPEVSAVSSQQGCWPSRVILLMKRATAEERVTRRRATGDKERQACGDGMWQLPCSWRSTAGASAPPYDRSRVCRLSQRRCRCRPRQSRALPTTHAGNGGKVVRSNGSARVEPEQRQSRGRCRDRETER